MEAYAKTHSNVALERIDIDSWDSPVAKQFRLNSIPYVRVYGPEGKLEIDGTSEAMAWLNSPPTAKQ